MDPLSILTLIGIIGTVVGGILTNRSNRSNVASTNQTNQQIAQETNQAQSLLAQQQHSWNVSDWQMQAAYDAPAAQMQRFRDAGLNPSLIYGQMSGGPSIESTSLPSLTAIPNQAFQAFNPTENLASDILSAAQARKTDVETEIMKEKLPHEIQALKDSSAQLKSSIDEINQNIIESQRRVQSMDIEDQLKVAQKARIEFQSQFDNKNFEFAIQQFKQDVKESNSRILLNDSHRRNYDALTKITNREYRELLGTWKYRLLGLDLENQRIQQALDLGVEEINNARKNGEILGFQISNGRIQSTLDDEVYDDLTGKNGWYNYYKTKLNLKLARDFKTFGDSGRLLLRIGK